MKKSDIYEVAIKILGLYVLLFTCTSLLHEVIESYGILKYSSGGEQIKSINTKLFILVVMHFVLVALFGAFLTLKTKTIVQYICSATDFEETVSFSMDKKVILEIALMVTGLLLIVWGLPDFLLKLKDHIYKVQSDFPRNENEVNFLILSGLKILIGGITVTYAKAIASYLIKDEPKGSE
jgi:hypothetical protein